MRHNLSLHPLAEAVGRGLLDILYAGPLPDENTPRRTRHAPVPEHHAADPAGTEESPETPPQV